MERKSPEEGDEAETKELGDFWCCADRDEECDEEEGTRRGLVLDL